MPETIAPASVDPPPRPSTNTASTPGRRPSAQARHAHRAAPSQTRPSSVAEPGVGGATPQPRSHTAKSEAGLAGACGGAEPGGDPWPVEAEALAIMAGQSSVTTITRAAPCSRAVARESLAPTAAVTWPGAQPAAVAASAQESNPLTSAAPVPAVTAPAPAAAAAAVPPSAPLPPPLPLPPTSPAMTHWQSRRSTSILPPLIAAHSSGARRAARTAASPE
mmetsp:Transcript_25522/g.96192  ORF Transcript_25522/g.96192 Transcript_25522/m.96192 type:complete len:220 (-) Transcript_25522:918-1577(-)